MYVDGGILLTFQMSYCSTQNVSQRLFNFATFELEVVTTHIHMYVHICTCVYVCECWFYYSTNYVIHMQKWQTRRRRDEIPSQVCIHDTLV